MTLDHIKARAYAYEQAKRIQPEATDDESVNRVADGLANLYPHTLGSNERKANALYLIHRYYQPK